MNELSAVGELLWMLMKDPRTGVLIVTLIVAAVVDLRSYRIPNWLTVSGMVFGLIYNLIVPTAPNGGLLWSLQGLATGFFLMLPLYLLRVMGAGDVKLMAMAGSFLGVDGVFQAALWVFLTGGIAAIGYAVTRRALGRMFANIRQIAQIAVMSAVGGLRPSLQLNAQASVGKLPYGVSIAIGTIGWLLARQLGYL
jgi:prepilin peptidase CpaA